MSKGYLANKERVSELNSFGKTVGNYKPDEPPALDSVALLCTKCRLWAGGGKYDANELHAIRNALWSDVPAVAEGAARVMSGCRESWVRDAIEESFIDEKVKAEILKK
jgi:hypothetical protein